MKIILLQNIAGVGEKNDVKNVADGYAMNFLIPNQLAEVATPARIKKVEEIQKQEAEAAREEEEQYKVGLAALRKTVLEMKAKASEKGGLFKNITVSAVTQALKEQEGITLPRGAIKLKKPIKEVGEYAIPVEVGDKTVQLKLVVKAL